ncbi:hypothetical protein Q5M85_22205 [Paraclostridium bifermentans]|nr:hypothetical protein [Paraclostridium bifermentans]
MGILLLLIGTLSLLFKNLGIKVLSFGLGAVCLFLAYLNLKTINELKRYESKETLKPYKNREIILIIVALLFFIFPQQIQGFFSSILGAYLLVTQIIAFLIAEKILM